MVYPRSGFTPARDPDTRYVNNYAVSAGTLPLCKGDAVRIAGGNITALAGGMDPGAGWGVVLDVFTTANRPLTFQNNKCITSGGVGRADVCWDPNMTYFVSMVASAGLRDWPANVMIDATAVNTTLGQSTMAVTTQTSASVGNPFKVIGYAPFDELTGAKATAGSANQGVEVAWNNHLLKAGT